jgi:hypothetical protein
MTDVSRHAGCGGLMGMSQEAPPYMVEHEGWETRIPGSEMIGLRGGERIRSQDQVEPTENEDPPLGRCSGGRAHAPCSHTVLYRSTCSGLAGLLFGTGKSGIGSA